MAYSVSFHEDFKSVRRELAGIHCLSRLAQVSHGKDVDTGGGGLWGLKPPQILGLVLC